MLNKLLVNTAVLSLVLLGFSSSPSLAETPGNLRQQKLLADADLLNAIRRVTEELAQMISSGGGNTPLAIPLGTNSPISIGRMPDEGQLTDSNLEAIGYMGADGQAKAITAIDISNMADVATSNWGITTMTPEAQEVLLADASGMLAQRRRIPTLDLIVRNRRTNARYLIPRVNANAFSRDAYNAVLNRTLRRLDTPITTPTGQSESN